jgi:hypothetical protein
MCTLDGLLTHRLGLGRGSATLQGGGDAGLNGLGLSAVGTTVRAEGDPKDLRALARGEVQVTPRKGVARHGGLRTTTLRPRGVHKPGRERNLHGWK